MKGFIVAPFFIYLSLAVLHSQSSEQVNEALGQPVFSGASLWEEAPGSVAERLQWLEESVVPGLLSFRLYAEEDYRIAGARPYSCALYGKEGKVALVSLVFANKGDVLKNTPPSEIKERIEREASAIGKLLEELFGEPERDAVGRDELRVRVLRWDWQGHSFLLSELEGEYVALQIMPVAQADNNGLSARISERELREHLEQQVMKYDNGDVVLKGIPMVDQGPKGYCVPATIERYLRYIGLPADMYLLAMAGSSDGARGTYLSVMFDAIEGYISDFGRKLRKQDDEATIRKVRRHIDEGLPILWVHFSTPEFNTIANERSLLRAKVEDWAAWIRRCEQENDEAESAIKRKSAYGHVALIVGYNERTGELCLSDSWGPGYEARWVTEAQAAQVDAGTFFIIDF